MRVAGLIAVPWADFQRVIAQADRVPEGAMLIRNEVGNLAVVSAEGDYIGFIDPLVPEVVLNV